MSTKVGDQYPSLIRQNQENLSWILSLRTRVCGLESLNELIQKNIPRLIGHYLDSVIIDLNQWNIREDAKYGRTIDFSRLLELIRGKKSSILTLGDGIYIGDNEARGLIVQREQCIGLALSPSLKTYNEVVQMGNMIVSRGDKASSLDRKELGFDGNYKPRRILCKEFDNSVPPLMAAFIQFVHRYCTEGNERNVIHTDGHVICDGKVRYKRERALLNIVKSIYGEGNVRRNVYLPEMEGLEFDIWIPSLRIAVEYQGQQHRDVVELWGGKDGLAQRKEYDERKRRLAVKNRITLIEFWYDEEVNKDLVISRLGQHAEC